MCQLDTEEAIWVVKAFWNWKEVDSAQKEEKHARLFNFFGGWAYINDQFKVVSQYWSPATPEC